MHKERDKMPVIRPSWAMIALISLIVGLGVSGGASLPRINSSASGTIGDTLIVQIGPLPQTYMYFDPTEANQLVTEILASVSNYDTVNPICSGSTTQNPFACVGIGSGVVNNSQACLLQFFGYWLCSSWESLATGLLSLPSVASTLAGDFEEFGVFGLPNLPDGLQTAVQPDPVQIVTTEISGVESATASATQSLLNEEGCFGSSESQPQFVIEPGNYLVVAVSGLTIPANTTIDLSGLGSAPVSETSADPTSVLQTAPDCQTGQPLASSTLNTPYAVNCSNSTAVPNLQAQVVDSTGAQVSSDSVTLPVSAAPTSCSFSSPPTLRRPGASGNSGTTSTSTSTTTTPVPAPTVAALTPVACGSSQPGYCIVGINEVSSVDPSYVSISVSAWVGNGLPQGTPQSNTGWEGANAIVHYSERAWQLVAGPGSVPAGCAPSSVPPAVISSLGDNCVS